MEIKNYNSNTYFQAKYLKSESLTDVVNYALEHGKFNRLNQARKNVDNAYLRTRLRVHICYTDDKPTLIISRYNPQYQTTGMSLDEYVLTAQTEFIAKKQKNPLKFALEKLIELGNNAPDNKMFKQVVVEKGEIIDPFFA